MRYVAIASAVVALSLAFAQDFPPEFERPWEDWDPPVFEMPEPNSYHLYQLAFDLLEDFESPPRDATDEVVRASIEGFDLAYQALQQAQMGECRFPPLAEPEQLFPELAGTRNACRFMVAHAKVNALDGRMAQAALDFISCVRIGAAASSSGMSIAGLTAVACEAIGLRDLGEIIPGLQADECRVVIEALRAAEADRVPLSEVMRGEQIFGKLLMKRMFAEVTDTEEADRRLAAMTPEDRAKAEAEWNRLMQQGTELFNPDNSWRKHGEWFGLFIEQLGKPYWERAEIPLSGDLLVDIAVPVYLMAQVKFAITDTTLRLALCQLAAQGYMVEWGGPPQNLEVLVPEFLPFIPDDPFRAGTLSFTTLDGEFIIYSVGPDGEDNGGTPIEGRLDADSDGDIVVRL